MSEENINKTVSEENIDLNLRSDAIQDIMEKSPAWIIRWGITTVFAIIVFGICLTWFMKYPDIIHGQVSITNSDLPLKMVSMTSGNITKIYVKDGEVVKAGTLLAEIENPLSVDGVVNLKAYLDDLESAISRNEATLPLFEKTELALGDLQLVMNEMQKEIVKFNLRKKFGVDDKEMASLSERIRREQESLAITENMLQISLKELENARIQYQADKALYEKGVSSKSDFRLQETNFRSKELLAEQLKQSKIQITISLNSLKAQYDQSGYSKVSNDQTGYEIVKAHLETMNNFIHGWKQRFSFIAPKDGMVTFLLHLQERQFIKMGDEIFAILQPENAYLGLATIPATGAGKVKPGQKVNILLDNFPFYEYGMVGGEVLHVSELPKDNLYRVEISMPNGTLTTYGDTLQFRPEMLGSVEIITEDKRVLERILESFIKLFRKKS